MEPRGKRVEQAFRPADLHLEKRRLQPLRWDFFYSLEIPQWLKPIPTKPLMQA